MNRRTALKALAALPAVASGLEFPPAAPAVYVIDWTALTYTTLPAGSQPIDPEQIHRLMNEFCNKVRRQALETGKKPKGKR